MRCCTTTTGENLGLFKSQLMPKRLLNLEHRLASQQFTHGAAVRNNVGGKVIGTELIAQKVIQARKNITEAGL